jgi:hypothetical protein
MKRPATKRRLKGQGRTNPIGAPMSDRLIQARLLGATVVVLGLGWLLPSAARAADVESEAKSMSFEQCLGVIRQMASQFAIAPINIVETNELRIVRFCVSDGSVLVSCSRPDQKMVMTRSRHRSGCD